MSSAIAQIWDMVSKSVTFQVSIAIIFGGIVLLVSIFLKYTFKRHFYSRKLPGRPVSFFSLLGNIGEINHLTGDISNFNVALLRLLEGYYKEFRKHKLFCFWASYQMNVMLVKADALEILMTTPKTNKKGWAYTFLHPWLGTGLLTSEGAKWKSRRRLLTPSFHFDILKDFLPAFNEQSQTLVNILHKEASKDWIDIVKPATLCSMDIMCETILGVSVGAQNNTELDYVKAVIRASDVIAERMVNPKFWIDQIFALTSTGRQNKKDIKLLHNFTRSLIREKKQKLLSGGSLESLKKKRKALMDALLEQNIQTKEMSEEDIREEVDTFAFEGHDTTSMGVSWSLFLIGHNPDVQEKIHEELDRIFGDDTERHATTDDLKDMEYLDRVLKETQRIYPSVPFISRENLEDLTIAGHTIPKGTQITILSYFIHRDPDVFPDPEKFDPDRFLPENTAKRHAYAYIPFSAGPRNCIGQRFAIMEEKVVISTVLRSFSVKSLDPREETNPAAEIVLRPSAPVRIKLSPRKFH